MKIGKRDLPRKNFTWENIMYSLAKAINNKREGNYLDCGFENENELIECLDALEKTGIIIKKNNITHNCVDLKNYKFIINPLLSFKNKNKFLKWLKENAVSLISIALTFRK